MCVVIPPEAATSVSNAWPGRQLPAELVEFWLVAGGARLFEDPEYGQWGVVLLSASASSARTASELRSRPEDFDDHDIVIGEFLGDQELLVYSAAEGVLVALPLDERADWFRSAPTLAEFIEQLIAAHGEKYWERR